MLAKQDQVKVPHHKRHFLIYILSVFLLISFLVLYVWQRVQRDYLVSEIQRLNKEKTQLLRKYDSLKVEIYELSSQERIERVAVEELDMHYPELGKDYFIIETEKENNNDDKEN